MRFDFAQYAHPGDRQASLDAVRLRADDDQFAAVICDGLGGADKGESVSAFISERILADAASAVPLPLALLAAHQALREKQAGEPDMAFARSTAAVYTLAPETGVLNWATVGDTRLYVFSGEARSVAPLHISPDDSAGYAAYLRGETDHEGIRLFDARDCLTASLGDERQPQPHEGAARLVSGDAVLLCSDGFWEYVFDLEMQIDLRKAEGAEQWLRLMLLRLTQRSHLAGDALSAVACMVL